MWQLAAMAGGAALSAYGKMQENEMNNKLLQMKRQQLNDQNVFLTKADKLNTSQERSQMSAAATIASVNSKNASVQAFQQESAQEASVGTSGTVGGTAFFNLDKTIAETRSALFDANSVSADNMRSMQTGFQQTDLQFDQQRNDLDWQGKYLDLQADQNEYSNSPLSWGLTMASGALNGLSMGNRFMAAGNEMGLFLPKDKVPVSTGVSTTNVPLNMNIGMGSAPNPSALSVNMMGGFGGSPSSQVPFSMQGGWTGSTSNVPTSMNAGFGGISPQTRLNANGGNTFSLLFGSKQWPTF